MCKITAYRENTPQPMKTHPTVESHAGIQFPSAHGNSCLREIDPWGKGEPFQHSGTCSSPMVFQHSGERDFDHGGGFHQHSLPLPSNTCVVRKCQSNYTLTCSYVSVKSMPPTTRRQLREVRVLPRFERMFTGVLEMSRIREIIEAGWQIFSTAYIVFDATSSGVLTASCDECRYSI